MGLGSNTDSQVLLMMKRYKRLEIKKSILP